MGTGQAVSVRVWEQVKECWWECDTGGGVLVEYWWQCINGYISSADHREARKTFSVLVHFFCCQIKQTHDLHYL